MSYSPPIVLVRTSSFEQNAHSCTSFARGLALASTLLIGACGESGTNSPPAGTEPGTESATSAASGVTHTSSSPTSSNTTSVTTSTQTSSPSSSASTSDTTPSATTSTEAVTAGESDDTSSVDTSSTSGEATTSPTTDTSVDTSTTDTGSADTGSTSETSSSPNETGEQPCGAKYTAIGDGGWLLCARLADGGGACSDKGTATFHRVTYEDGSAISNVAQVSGFGDTSVGVVTTDGALYTGVGPTGIKKTAVISEGVVNFSGGYHSRVALTKTDGKFGVVGWVDTGSPAAIALPSEVTPIQVSGNYGLACALTTIGDVYCWEAGGNHNIPNITATPSKVALDGPVSHVSVGQNTVCGVTLDNKLTCVAAWYDNPWLPSEGQAPDFTVRQNTFPEVREVHAGFHQGIIVNQAGEAYFLDGNGSPGQDNPGSLFASVSGVVAAGGDRGNACVQNAMGELYCWVSGATQATLEGAPLQVEAAACPL